MSTGALHRRKQAEEPSEEEELLDDQEQDQFIATIKGEFHSQVRKTKLLSGSLGAILTCLYLISAVIQVQQPWRLLHQAVFKGTVDPSSIVVAEIGGAVNVFAATAAIFAFGYSTEVTWRKILTFSLTIALFMFGFWSTAMFKAFKVGQLTVVHLWRVFWRPFVPGLIVALAVKAIDDMEKIRLQISELHASKYRLKKA